jgi:hypothetical protein
LEPATEKKSSPREVPERPTLPTLSVRMARVEDLLNAMVNRVPGVEGRALDAWRISKFLVVVLDDLADVQTILLLYPLSPRTTWTRMNWMNR